MAVMTRQQHVAISLLVAACYAGAPLATSGMFVQRLAVEGDATNEASTHADVGGAHGEGAGKDDEDPQTCVSLRNMGSHCTVTIGVGTPPQKFNVVADSASNAVIVPSCTCNAQNHCDGRNHCFRGTGKSSTFRVGGAEWWSAKDQQMIQAVPEVIMSFGSGEIASVVATDVVSVGSKQALMNESVLLMVDQALNINGPFEGILGLGIPPQVPDKLSQTVDEDEDFLDFKALTGFPNRWPMSSIVGKIDAIRKRRRQAAAAAVAAMAAAGAKTQPQPFLGNESRIMSFLEAAHIPRFSLCFNDNSQDGVMRLSGEPHSKKLASYGQVHWGVSFEGISVGDMTLPVLFCDPKSATAPGQLTACGAIPDSGTTAITGPADQVAQLYAVLCNQWERCRSHAEQQKGLERGNEVSIRAFEELLMRCEEWIEQESLDSLPLLHFHIGGSNGEKQTLTIPPRAYIIQTEQTLVKHFKSRLFGLFDIDIALPTNHASKVCIPAFGSMAYNTLKNGPVWILGGPIFYVYQVGYDLTTSPPSMTFKDAPCGQCNDGDFSSPASLVLTRRQVLEKPSNSRNNNRWDKRRRGDHRRRPRFVKNLPRVKKWNTSLPL